MKSSLRARWPERLPKLSPGARPWMLALVATAIFAQVIALTPSSLERSQLKRLSPEALLQEASGPSTLATSVPRGKIPEYSMENFRFASTQNGIKQWKITSKKAFLYNAERLVHGREVIVQLYDADGKITTVTGDESQYFMNDRDIELFGNVRTVFPDGFETRSEYMKYRAGPRIIEVPTTFRVHGQGHESGSQQIRFDSNGLEYKMSDARIFLPKEVFFETVQEKGEKTEIESDHCDIERGKQLAHFTMAQERAPAERFVKVRQPNMNGRGRRADLNYGSGKNLLQHMSLFEDVLIREKKPDSDALRYGTGGRADFDAKNNLIYLRELPQVYQDNDTVTGDVIIVHRDTDIVEVDNSNAFSEGKTDANGKQR